MNQKKLVCITSSGSISPLGADRDEIISSYNSTSSCIKPCPVNTNSTVTYDVLVAPLRKSSQERLDNLMQEDKRYGSLDKSVLMAIYAARQCLDKSNLSFHRDKKTLVTIGSSRGATGVWENSHQAFINKGRAPVLTSPTTTLGNIATWVAQDLGIGPYAISHSMTCSSALEAIANGIAWLKAGLCDQVLAGGSEAPVTSFTIAQMEALSIYANHSAMPYPCTPFAKVYSKSAGMVLGEGSALFLIELKDPDSYDAKNDIIIDSIGFGSENITHPTSITSDGECLYSAMQEAFYNKERVVNAICAHAPGTRLGDKAERAAIDRVFGSDTPQIFSNKWRIGHTLGSSGALSLEYSILVLKGLAGCDFPYPTELNKKASNYNKILINSAGFGGHAISLLIGH